MSKIIKAAIIGASGYTGSELIRVLYGHNGVEISYLIAGKSAGKSIGEIYPHLKQLGLPDIVALSDANFDDIDVAFCCLPHATSQEVILQLPSHLKIIDLSADFRLKDVDLYEKWYGGKHKAPELQKTAAYGLSEICRDEIRSARIVACPGCYPTSALLPLSPLLEQSLISQDNIIIDSKSGTTGAGRSAKQNLLFSEINESAKAYAICNHRHMPEMEQLLSNKAGNYVVVSFTPQLVPMSRGIISTIYVKTTADNNADDLRNTLQAQYDSELFVHILPKGEFPTTRDVVGTNQCVIAVAEGRTKNSAIIVSVIDNLTKGSSGQAVQNMNIMFGLAEDMGLKYAPIFP